METRVTESTTIGGLAPRRAWVNGNRPMTGRTNIRKALETVTPTTRVHGRGNAGSNLGNAGSPRLGRTQGAQLETQRHVQPLCSSAAKMAAASRSPMQTCDAENSQLHGLSRCRSWRDKT